MEHLVWITLLVTAAFCRAEDPYLLLVQQNEITRVSLDGQTLTPLLTGLPEPDALAVDYDSGLIFFTDISTNSVCRGKLDGNDTPVAIVENLGEPSDVALDTQMTRVYWSDSGNGNIGSCDYNGENKQLALVSGLNDPSSIVLDLNNNKIYWLHWVSRDGGTQYVIGRANLDGTSVDNEMKDIQALIPSGYSKTCARFNALYKYDSTRKNQAQRLTACQEDGATLAMPESAEEAECLISYLKTIPLDTSEFAALDLHVVASGARKHEIMDGQGNRKEYMEQFWDTTWSLPQPDHKGETCVALTTGGAFSGEHQFKLHDVYCTSEQPFVCRFKAGWPDTITRDPATGKLLWSDTSQRKIFSMDPENTAVVAEVADGEQMKGLAVHGTTLFFTELFKMRLMKVAMENGATEEVKSGLVLPRRLVVVKPPAETPGPAIVAPRLRKGIGRGGAVKFVCVLPDAQTQYLVTWRSASGDLTNRPVTGRSASLEISNAQGFKLGVRDTMACIVQTRTMENGQIVLGDEVSSNVYQAEIKLLTLETTVQEGQSAKKIFIQVTGPPFFFGDESFFLEPELKREVFELRDDDGKVIDQVVVEAQPGQRTSRVHVTGANWFKKHAIPVKARIDGINGGDTQRTLIIWRVRGDQTEGGRRRKRNAEDKVGETTVEKLDIPGGTCSAVNDPHLTSSNGVQYEMHEVGEFVLYRHPFFPFQINVVLQNCLSGLPHATCVCAVYVKVKNDVFAFHRCTTVHTNYDQQLQEPLRVYVIGKYDSGAEIFSEDEGRKHTVDMGRKRKVVVEYHYGYLAAHFTPNAEDFEQAGGLCGFYDNDTSNDLKARTGEVYTAPPYQPFVPPPYPHDPFNKSWRVKKNAGESLLRGVVEARPEDAIVYCSVLEENAVPFCHEDMDVALSVDADKVKKPVAINRTYAAAPDDNAVHFVGEARRRKKRSVDSISGGFDPFAPIIADIDQPAQYATWPTAKGRTEQEAIDICSTSINDHPGVQLCSVMQNDTFQDAIDGCVLDIKNTDDLSWVDDAISGILERCAIFVTQVNTTAPDNAPPQLLPNGVNKTELRATMCPKNCSGTGVCSEGACSCNTGFVGADCSMRLTDPPEITVLLETFCDLSELSCAEAIVYGEKFHNRETLTCHLQEYTLGQPLPVGNSLTVKAEFTKFDQIACPVPDRRPYIIQASNDGVNVAKRRLLFAPLDLSCMECGMTSLDDIPSARCTVKASMCLIDGQCYADMVVNPMSSCDVCDPSVSQDEWTTVKGNAECGGNADTTLVIALCAVAGVLILALVGGVTFFCLRERAFVNAQSKGKAPLPSKDSPSARANPSYQP